MFTMGLAERSHQGGIHLFKLVLTSPEMRNHWTICVILECVIQAEQPGGERAAPAGGSTTQR